MKTLSILLVTFITIHVTSAQSFNQFYADIVAQTSQTNVLNDLTAFEHFGIKTVGSKALANTENWVTSRYKVLGYSDVELQPFTYSSGTSNNIIVTKRGTLYPNTFLIIDAHYDTINGPGTNDNGTGTVLLLELARLLQEVDTEYSIKFIHFSGEEDGLIGSKYYLKNTVIPENLDIKLVLNIDEIGGVNGMTNDTVVCERDLRNPKSNNKASNDTTNKLATLIGLYSSLKTKISNAFASDYIPFEKNGEIITGLYESNVSPVNHTINDNIANMDVTYAYEVIKGSVGAALEFGVAFETLSAEEQKNFNELINIIATSTTNEIIIEFKTPIQESINFKIIDTSGKLFYQDIFSEQNNKIVLDDIAPTEYIAVFTMGNKRFMKTIVIN